MSLLESLPEPIHTNILLWQKNPILATCSVGDGGATQRPFFTAAHDRTTWPSFERYTHEGIDLPAQVAEALSFFPADRELYLPSGWTIMSVEEMRRLGALYVEHGQSMVQPFAHLYLGMGHIKVFACRPQTLQTFVYRDGGSNGYDRDDNFLQVVGYNANDIVKKKRELPKLRS